MLRLALWETRISAAMAPLVSDKLGRPNVTHISSVQAWWHTSMPRSTWCGDVQIYIYIYIEKYCRLQGNGVATHETVCHRGDCRSYDTLRVGVAVWSVQVQLRQGASVRAAQAFMQVQ